MISEYLGIMVSPPMVALFLLITVSLCRNNLAARRDDFITAVGWLVFSAVAVNLHLLIVKLTFHTLDPALQNIDQRLGFPTLWFESWQRVPVVGQFLLTSYEALPVVMAAVWLREQNLTMRRAMLLSGLFCWFFYVACPAVGPRYYDWAAQTAQVTARNAMPSMHLTWALLMAFNSPRKWKVVLWSYALVIAASTVILGQHYLVDLIVAVPYAVVMQHIAKAGWFRRICTYNQIRNRPSSEAVAVEYKMREDTEAFARLRSQVAFEYSRAKALSKAGALKTIADHIKNLI